FGAVRLKSCAPPKSHDAKNAATSLWEKFSKNQQGGRNRCSRSGKRFSSSARGILSVSRTPQGLVGTAFRFAAGGEEFLAIALAEGLVRRTEKKVPSPMPAAKISSRGTQ